MKPFRPENKRTGKTFLASALLLLAPVFFGALFLCSKPVLAENITENTEAERTEISSKFETDSEDEAGIVDEVEGIENVCDYEQWPTDEYSPTHYENTKVRHGLKSTTASAIPSAYQADIASLISTYPATREQAYNTCWAYASAGAAEFSLIHQGLSSASPANLLDFSELQLAYFAMNPCTDPMGNTAADTIRFKTENSNFLNTGYNLFGAFRTLTQWKGLADQSDYPNENAESVLANGLTASDAFDKDRAYLTQAKKINLYTNPEGIKKYIMEYGSVATSYYADQSGSYMGSDGVSYYYTPTVSKVNHAVMIVGWDDDYDRTKFDGQGEENLPTENGAWLIRNSWTTTTGLSRSSYFWISYESQGFTKGSYAEQFTPSEDYCDNNYQYDGGAYSYYRSYKKGTGYTTVANVFTVNGTAGAGLEELEKVSFTMTGYADVDYMVEIYTGLSQEGGPETGTLVAEDTITGTTDYAGFYTLDLPTPVLLNRGDRFAVVVTTDKAYIDQEYGWEMSNIHTGVGAENGQSYYLADGVWTPLEVAADSVGGTFGNYCIKAYTSDVYRVSFETELGENPDSSVVKNGETYGTLPAPEYTGYTFDGWYTADEGGEQITEDTLVNLTDAVTLYAHWKGAQTATPLADLDPAETVAKGSRVSLTCTTPGAEIYYTTDTAIATSLTAETGILYTEPLIINEDTTIWALAVCTYRPDSEVLTLTYTLIDTSSDWDQVEEEDRTELADPSAVETDSYWVGGIPTETDYTGSAITFPGLRVYYGKTKLISGRDYTVNYKNNKKASTEKSGPATVTITGKGNYSGTITKTFTILPLDLNAVDSATGANCLTAENITLASTNGKKVQKGTTAVYYTVNGQTKKLTKGTDYDFVYDSTDDYKADGLHTVQIVGKGNYTGTASFTETIGTDQRLISKATLSSIKAVYATGEAVMPTVKLTYRTQDSKTYKTTTETLVEGEDYTLTCFNNVTPGTATVIIHGIGDFTGVRTATFTVKGIPISKAKLATGLTAQPYTGEATAQTGYVLTYQAGSDGTMETLTEGTDYTVSYSNNVNAGSKAAMIFTGMGRFSGSKKVTYTITRKDLAELGITETDLGSFPYTKGGTKPITIVKDGDTALVKGVDYTLSYSNYKKITEGVENAPTPTLTVKGKGNYCGSIVYSYAISTGNLADATLTVSDVKYKNKINSCAPAYKVTDSNGVQLTTADYDTKNITYTYAQARLKVPQKDGTYRWKWEGDPVDLKKDLVPAGAILRITIPGKGNYAGTSVSGTYRIYQASMATAKVTIPAQIYTGSSIRLSQSQITVKVGGQTLTGADYEIVSYKNNTAAGKAQVTLRGKGNYGGRITAKFTITKKSLE